MQVEPAIEVAEVVRVFGDGADRTTALDGVTFAVGAGEIVGLLGSNGAGKTTLTKILSTVLLPTSGTARVLGIDVVRDPKAARAVQSVVFGGDRGLYGRLSARENLRFFGMLGGLSRRALRMRLDGALDEVGLGDVADRTVSTFSKGMRQRLHIAIGMISRPRVLLLDEPTVGLDPVEAARLRRSVADLRSRGVSVLLTSHYLLDIEELADRVVILNHGRVSHQMTVAEFTASVGHVATVVVRGGGAPPEPATVGGMGTLRSRIETGIDSWTMTLWLRDWTPEVFAALSRAMAGTRVHQVEVAPSRLEDAFLNLGAEVRR
jgi:ABC-2 type transport system ATP-binding protein